MNLTNKELWKAAMIRAIRTVLQTALALLGTTALIDQVNWTNVLTSSLLAGALSLLTSMTTGLPEAPNDEE